MTDQSTALATLANISDLIEGRDQSIALWMKARDDFHATTKAASLASIGGGISLNIPYGHRYEESELARAFISEATHDEVCPVTRQRTTISAREHFEQLITAEVDRRNWRGLMENLGFDQADGAALPDAPKLPEREARKAAAKAHSKQYRKERRGERRSRRDSDSDGAPRKSRGPTKGKGSPKPTSKPAARPAGKPAGRPAGKPAARRPAARPAPKR